MGAPTRAQSGLAGGGGAFGRDRLLSQYSCIHPLTGEVQSVHLKLSIHHIIYSVLGPRETSMLNNGLHLLIGSALVVHKSLISVGDPLEEFICMGSHAQQA